MTPENNRKPWTETFYFLVFSGGIKWEYWTKIDQLLAELVIMNIIIAKTVALSVFLYTKSISFFEFFLFYRTGEITLWGKVSEYATRFASFTFKFGKLIFVSST